MVRNVNMWREEHGIKPSHIIRDRDARFTAQSDGTLESTGATLKKSPRKPANLNAYAEALVGTFRRECLDRFIVFGKSLPDHVCRVCEDCHSSVRVHSSPDDEPVGACEPPADPAAEKGGGIVCESRHGGALRHFRRVAA